MAPLGLAVLLFLAFALFGKAFLESVGLRTPLLRNWLIAPTIGYALIEILVCFFNQFCGLPVKDFAGWMFLFLLLSSTAVFWWKRPVLPIRYMAPFGGVLAFSLLYTGWPALIRGFNWMSFVNGDMTYFAAGAVRLLEHPFYSIPPVTDLLGWDYSQLTWKTHVLEQVRCGGEMLLAWSAGVTRLNPLQLYMPVMLALQLAQLCSAAALVLAYPHCRRLAFLTAAILSLSPMFSLGTFYQLLPQAGGLPAMLTLTVVLAIDPLSLRRAWAYCLLLAVVLSVLFLHYPEIIAFGVISGLIFRSLRFARERRISRLWLACAALSPVLSFVIIREAMFTGIANTLTNVQSAALTGVAASTSLFPQFMVPSGLPTLFGLVPFGKLPQEPFLSGVILIGFALFAAVLVRVIIDLRAGRLYAAMLGFMLGVGILFFYGSNDYGLFKLSMFCQASLAACLAFLLSNILRRYWRFAPVFILLGTGASQLDLLSTSAGLADGGMIEVPGASALGVVFNVPTIRAISDISLRPAYGLAAIVFRGSQVLYPSMVRGKFLKAWPGDRSEPKGPSGEAAGRPLREPGENPRPIPPGIALTQPFIQRAHLVQPASPTPPGTRTPRLALLRPVGSTARTKSVRERLIGPVQWIKSLLKVAIHKYESAGAKEDREVDLAANHLEKNWGTEFYDYPASVIGGNGQPTHLLTFRTTYLLNATSHLRNFSDFGMFRIVPYGDVQNWLLYIPSSRGPDYYIKGFGAAFYQPGPDPYNPKGFVSAVGRFMLLEVVHPTEHLRVRLSLTRSILGAHQVVLPTKTVLEGASTVRLPLVGSGAAAVYSDAIAPMWNDGHAYIAVDFAQGTSAFPNNKTGLMRLYGREWVADHRRLIGFVRDISVISEEDFRHLERPRAIATFPSSLVGASATEYSGIYEDGWISDESYIKLGPSKAGEQLTVRGRVPELGTLANGRLKLVTRINNEPACERVLKPGAFRFAIPIQQASAITTLHLQFSDHGALPGEDGRLVSALIHSIGFE